MTKMKKISYYMTLSHLKIQEAIIIYNVFLEILQCFNEYMLSVNFLYFGNY